MAGNWLESEKMLSGSDDITGGNRGHDDTIVGGSPKMSALARGTDLDDHLSRRWLTGAKKCPKSSSGGRSQQNGPPSGYWVAPMVVTGMV